MKQKAARSYSSTPRGAVPLPQVGLTSEFGMGSGISPPQSAQPKRGLKRLTACTFGLRVSQAEAGEKRKAKEEVRRRKVKK